MGGITSGRRRSTNRGSVEHFPAIDLRILKRAELLRGGECTYTTLYWGNQAPEALSARIFIDLSDIDDASMRVIGDGHGGVITQRVTIEAVPCPYGGFRVYFLCPLWGIRCEQLFLVDGVFASRKAHRLAYASQSEDNLSRSRRKVRKLHRQVEGDYRYKRLRGRNRWNAVLNLKAANANARALYRNRLKIMVDDTL